MTQEIEHVAIFGANRTPLGVQSLSTTRFSSEPRERSVPAVGVRRRVGADGGDDALAVDVAKSEIKSPVVGADALTGSGFFLARAVASFPAVDPSESMFNFGVEFKDAPKARPASQVSAKVTMARCTRHVPRTSANVSVCRTFLAPSIVRPPAAAFAHRRPGLNPSIRPPPRRPPLITDVVDDGTSL